MKKSLEFFTGFVIIFGIYYISLFILKTLNIPFPAAIFALIIFAFLLSTGLIKQEWVKSSSNFMLKNMPVLFVPFIVGLTAHKAILFKNWLSILLVVMFTTTLTIVVVGLFVEHGIKIVRYFKIKGVKND